MWFCTSGTNAFDKLGIWEFGGGKWGKGGKGEKGGEDGRTRWETSSLRQLLNLCSYLF